MTTSIDGIREDATVADTKAMRLEGIHHVTCITGNAPVNVKVYAGVLGLRLVKKTVNQDDPPSTTSSTPTRPEAPAPTSPSFRVSRRPPGPRRRRHGAHRHLPGVLRGGARVLGAAPGLPRPAPSTADGGPPATGSRIPRGWASSSSSPTSRTARWSPRTRRSRPSSPSRASTGFAPSRAIPHGAASCSSTCSDSSRRARPRGSLAAPSAAGSTRTIRRPPRGRACPAPERCTTLPGRRRWRITSRGSAASPRRARTRPP